jgi:hypothetical protein
MPWYQNPGWFALLVAAASVTVSTLAFRTSRRSLRVTVQQRLSQQIAEINEGFLKHGVKGPYALHLGIPDEEVPVFAAKSVILLHHLNLLRVVHGNRDVLGNRAMRHYETWAATILRKWIESDQHLLMTWKLFCDTRDLDGPDFHAWIQRHLPVTQHISLAGVQIATPASGASTGVLVS